MFGHNDPGSKATSELWRETRAWLAAAYPDACLVSEWSYPSEAIAGGFHVDFYLHFRNRGYTALFRKNTVTPFTGTAQLVGPDAVEVSGANAPQTLRARHIVIATGSAPIELPGLPFDGRHVVSSTEALNFRAVPSRLLVVGAGAVGLELGSVWHRLGAQVTVVEFMDRIVPGMDRGMGAQLQQLLEKQGLQFRFLCTTARNAVVTDRGVTVTLESGSGTNAGRAFLRVRGPGIYR